MLQENIVALSEGTQLNQSPAMALDASVTINQLTLFSTAMVVASVLV